MRRGPAAAIVRAPMKTPALLAALLLACAAASAHAQDAPFTPPEGDFSVAFPGPPSAHAAPAKRMSDVAYRRYVDQERDRAFIVDVAAYPEGDLPPSPDGAIYDRLMRSHADEDSSKLVSTRAARLAGRPCLEGTFTDPQGNIEVMRVLMVGDRIFKLSYAYADGVEDPAAPAAFFGSFKLTAP